MSYAAAGVFAAGYAPAEDSVVTATGALASIGLIPAQATAGAAATASAAMDAIGLTAAQASATAAAVAAGPMVGMSLTPAEAQAAVAAWASSELAAISMTAATASATVGVIPVRLPAGAGFSRRQHRIVRPPHTSTDRSASTSTTRAART